MGKKGGSAPKVPDPRETAEAESQFNRLDTYSPSGSGVRHGYTDSKGQFRQGVAPEGAQSAIRYLENPYEKEARKTLEPASLALTRRIVSDNIVGMPDAARAGNLPGSVKKTAMPEVGHKTALPSVSEKTALPNVTQIEDRGNVARNIFDRSFSMLAPAIDKSNERLLTNLQARGLPVGSEAFNDAYGEQQRQTQDTLSRLALDADIAAGSEQSRLFSLGAQQFGQGMNRANTEFAQDGAIFGQGLGLANTEFAQDSTLFGQGMDRANMEFAQDSAIHAQDTSRVTTQFGLDQAARSGAISEIVAAMGGGYNAPNSTPSGNAAGVNYSSLVGQQYQQQMAAYQQKQQQSASTAGALGSLGAALIKSTRAAKDIVGCANIEGAGAIFSNIPISAWTYKKGEAPAGDHGGRHIGPMAEDFQAMTGLGRSDRIDITDYLGVMAAALQSALLRIDELEAFIFDDNDAPPAREQARVH